MIAEAVLERVRRALLDKRVPAGYWEGHLSSSALATATAVVALATARRAGVDSPSADRLIDGGIGWLVAHRNADGGWGDTADSASNISTTALVWAALAFGRGEDVDAAAAAAEAWIVRTAGSSRPDRLAAALRSRYGKDQTFSVPILTMCAIAGRLGPSTDAWRLIPQLPFELAILPQRFFGALRLPVVSYALPALISMGLARHRAGPGIAAVRGVRALIAPRALKVLQRLQPAGGGFLEAVPLTSFVAMSLVAAGEPQNAVVLRGLAFLDHTVRADGSWPIDSNLAIWVTTLSVNALAVGGALAAMSAAERRTIRDWLLARQWRIHHPFTGAAPGGWAWTDLPGGVPDADDTAGALIALAHLGRDDPEVRDAAALGVRWLLDLQNRDGGIPTFCRGWGTLPFDRSATDLTAHALRAWATWRRALEPRLADRMTAAIERGIDFLSASQRADGAFVPLWFGNQDEERQENPVFGTSRVLAALVAASERGQARAELIIDRAELIIDRAELIIARAELIIDRAELIIDRAVNWLLRAQNADGGWGAAPGIRSSVEETAAAMSGLVAVRGSRHHAAVDASIDSGAAWLVRATEDGRHFPASPLGVYFARLWYSEELYPIVFAAAALEAAEVAWRCRSRAQRRAQGLENEHFDGLT